MPLPAHVSPQPKPDLQDFLGDQLTKPDFYYLVLATFTITLMAAWRKILKDQIYWSETE